MSIKTILVTGANGFLGSQIVKLLSSKYSLIALIRDTSKLDRIAAALPHIQTWRLPEQSVEQLFKEQEIDAIVHCAVQYGRDPLKNSEVVKANLQLPVQLLDLAAEFGCRYFVNADTFFAKHASEYSYLDAYRRSKRQFLEWSEQYQSKVAVLHLRLEHLYGPGDDPSKFIPTMVRDIVNGVKKIDLTPGEQKRDFIHVSDAASAFETVLAALDSAQPLVKILEVGTGKAHSVRELLETAKALAQSPTELRFSALPYRDHELMQSCANSGVLRGLGWKPKYSLKQGLEELVQYYSQLAR